MKTVLLFTGGIDSLVAHYYLDLELKEPHDLLYFNLGHRYSKQEMENAKQLAGRMGVDLRVEDFIKLGRFEEPDANIPARNLYLIMGAASLGYDKIYLIVQRGETSIPDRTLSFFINASSLLSTLYERDIEVDSPFWNMTKQDMVKWYKEKGLDTSLLIDTRSCYSPTKEECGNCPACFRKYVALVYNDIQPKFELKEEIISYYKEKLLKHEYDSVREKQTIEALKKVGLW